MHTKNLVVACSLALILAACGGGGGGGGGGVTAPCTASTIGSCWTLRSSGPGDDLNAAVSSPSRTVVVGNNGTIKMSVDGASFLTVMAGTDSYFSVAFDGSQFIADGVNQGDLATSADGIAWTVDPGVIGALSLVARPTGQMFGTISTVIPAHTLNPDNPQPINVDCIVSVDQSNAFGFPTTPCTFQVQGLLFTGTQFIAVGVNGDPSFFFPLIMTSPDGTTWTDVSPAGGAHALRGVATSGARYTAVGGGGTIFTSTDGTSWSPVTSGTTQGLDGVAWSGTQWVVVGAAGTVLTSPDGVAWTKRNSGTASDLFAVTWNGTRFIAVGAANTIITSP